MNVFDDPRDAPDVEIAVSGLSESEAQEQALDLIGRVAEFCSPHDLIGQDWISVQMPDLPSDVADMQAAIDAASPPQLFRIMLSGAPQAREAARMALLEGYFKEYADEIGAAQQDETYIPGGAAASADARRQAAKDMEFA